MFCVAINCTNSATQNPKLTLLKGGFHGSAHVSKSILSLASNQCYSFKKYIVVQLSLAIVSRGRSRMTKILRGFQQILPMQWTVEFSC